jgi:hypothetical protein
MRPSHFLSFTFLVLILAELVLFLYAGSARQQYNSQKDRVASITAGLGLTDLCISTEARYTRHPAVSDSVVPFMDHPGAIEHFPSGSFWAPFPNKGTRKIIHHDTASH